MTKIIAMVGDSHTWGQGVGVEYHYNPGVCGGDQRMVPFGFPAYVNLLRHAVNLSTGSSAVDYYGEELGKLAEEMPDDFAYFSSRPLELREKFSCVRIFFRAGTTDSAVEIYIDGVHTETVELPAEEQVLNRCLKAHFFRTEDGDHTLRLVPVNGAKIGVHRIECYSGEYAVINCGVGSCPARRYADEWYGRYVTPLEPWMIVFEGSTINDWLTRETTAEYADALRYLLAKMRASTDRILWHTVAPISGYQKTTDDAEPYDAYIDAMLRTAAEENLPLVDSNRAMHDAMKKVPKEWHARMLFHDDWHPNGTGHYIYAKTIFEELKKYL